VSKSERTVGSQRVYYIVEAQFRQITGSYTWFQLGLPPAIDHRDKEAVQAHLGQLKAASVEGNRYRMIRVTETKEVLDES
jgi:hypothetical protein